MASVIKNINTTSIKSHLYYPTNIEIANYLANDWSVSVLVGAFAGACLTILLVTLIVLNRAYPNLRGTEKAKIWWFVLSGSIHFFFEGYFALNHNRMGPAQDIFGQMWKEYALSDSRYLTSDPFVLCMETITAVVWGPLCFIVAALITLDHPLRHPMQIVVSVGQLYGVVLYYYTSMFDHYYRGIAYSRPEFLYFWVYYFILNFIWMIFPSIMLYNSISQIALAFKAIEKMSNVLQNNGSVKSNGPVKPSKKNI